MNFLGSAWAWGADMFTTVLGLFLGPSFTTGANLFGMYVLLTPSMLDMNWVRVSWGAAAISGAALTLIMLLLGLFFMYFKKESEINWKNTIIIVLIVISCSAATLLFVDLCVYGQQQVFNTLIHPVLEREYKSDSNAAILTDDDLEDDEITFSAFDTASLILLSYGAEFEEVSDDDDDDDDTEESDDTSSSYYSGLTGGVSDIAEEYFTTKDAKQPYEFFLLSNGGDGGFTMFLAMILAYAIGTVGVVRVAVLGVLAAGGPIWFQYALFSMKLSVIYAYIYLVNITILVGFIFQFAWVLAVLIVRADIGAGSQTCVLLIYLVALVLTIFFWMRSIIWAIRNPITLGAEKLTEQYGKTVSKMGDTFKDTGQFFGMKGVEKVGKNMEVHGSAMQQFSTDLSDGNVNGGIKNHLDALHNNQRRNYFETESKNKSLLGTAMGSAVETSEYTSISNKDLNQEAFVDLMAEYGLEDIVEVDGKETFVKNEYIEEVEAILQQKFVEDNMTGFNYNDLEGQVVINDTALESVRQTAKKQDMELLDVVYMDIDSGGKLKEMQTQLKNYSAIDAQADNAIYTDDGKVGVTIEDTERVDNLKEVFQTFGVEYTESGKNTLFFDQAGYEALDDKFNTFSELKTLGVKGQNQVIYNMDDEEELHEADQIKELLTKLDIGFEDKNTVFVQDGDVDAVINDLLTENEEALTIKEQRQYVSYKVDKQHVYEDLKEQLYNQLPAGSILSETKKSKKRKEILIDQLYADEAMRAIAAYDKKTPYWSDPSGMYLYRDGDIYILEVDPPEDGRYLGDAPVSVKGGIAS